MEVEEVERCLFLPYLDWRALGSMDIHLRVSIDFPREYSKCLRRVVELLRLYVAVLKEVFEAGVEYVGL